MRYQEDLIRYFMYPLVAFLAGIALASWLPDGWLINDLSYFIVAVSFLFCSLFIAFLSEKQSVKMIVFLLTFSSLFFGLWRFSLSEIRLQTFNLSKHYNEETILRAQIADSPQTVSNKTQLVLGEIEINSHLQTGNLLLTVYNQNNLHFGDLIHVRCKLLAPEPIEDFRYDRFLAKDDIIALCRQGEIVSVRKFEANWLESPRMSMLSLLFKFKNSWREILLSSMAPNEGSLVSGIMLGDGYLMSKELKDSYSRSGLSHVVAISGMNMTMISVFLLWLLIRLGLWRRQASSASIILIWLYTVAIGLPSSAVRASVMSTLMLTAYSVGRLAKAERILALAACFMLVINPRLLRDDVGFQLSFLAFLSLLWYYEPVRALLSKYITKKYLKVPLEIMSLTLAAQILTWPILAMNFQQVSIVAPFANLLVLWALGPLMILALLGSLSVLILSTSWPLAPSYLLASWLNGVATFFGDLPQGTYSFTSSSSYLFIVYYCGIMFLTFRYLRVKNDQDTSS